MLLVLALAGLIVPQTQADPPAPAEITVVARKRKCRVQLGNALLSDRELDAYAEQWAPGEAVRIHVPSNASYRCLAQIMFRLTDRGVTRAEFVDERTER